jgi:hypothetical protein
MLASLAELTVAEQKQVFEDTYNYNTIFTVHFQQLFCSGLDFHHPQ